MHQIGKNIFHVCRGEIVSAEGHSFLCVGGATSIDKEYRIEGESWWKEEHITDEDINHALENLSSRGGEVDFVLTHCADSNTAYFGLRMRPDSDTNQLSIIDYRAKYRMWLFGHYHLDCYTGRNKACLYNRIGYLNECSENLFSWLDDEEK